MEEKDYIIWLNSIQGVGCKTLEKLISYFGSAKNVFQASNHRLYDLKGINREIIHNIVQNKSYENIKNIKNDIKTHNIDVLHRDDERYPQNLKNIYDAPYILYMKGNIAHTDMNAIAIVGARKASPYGKWATYKLASELAKRGITIISGMAYGVDTAAHKGAIDQSGRTIAVLGCGLDTCYPKSNYNLMLQIQKNGAVLSEYGPGVQPLSNHFPARNRIISGMAKGVIVVEASEKSGSLITAEFALEQGRDVFAVPGNINSPLSRGTNKLIQDGAKLVTCVEDVLEELNIHICNIEPKRNMDLSDIEQSIYQTILEKQPIHMDILMTELSIRIEEVTGIITILQLKGLIKQLPGRMLITK